MQLLRTFSSTIGKPTKISLENIGFDYPTDTTLKPEVLFPQVLRISPLSGFKSIGITSFGKGYNQNPSLVVLDGVTKKPVRDVDLRYNPEQEIVEVLENTESLNNSTPTIIPIGNPNGIRAKNITYDNDTQEVTVTMKNTFSGTLNAIGEYIDPFPFSVGDKVLVENVSVGVGSTLLDITHQIMIMHYLHLLKFIQIMVVLELLLIVCQNFYKKILSFPEYLTQ